VPMVFWRSPFDLFKNWFFCAEQRSQVLFRFTFVLLHIWYGAEWPTRWSVGPKRAYQKIERGDGITQIESEHTVWPLLLQLWRQSCGAASSSSNFDLL
jgi:hypothetical protein